MGKSPGKWIKSALLWKKSLKSSSSKGKNTSKTPNSGEVTVSSRASESGINGDQGLLIPPASQVGAGSAVDIDNGLAANLPDEGVSLPCPMPDESGNKATYLGSPEDSEIIKHEKAAIKAQATIRGYLARQAFQTLKGIIRLQALVRGNLVRRQAVATLCCMGAIVKFQALVRGQKVRFSSIGIEVQNICNLGKIKNAECSVSSEVHPLAMTKQVCEHVFSRKLLASTSGPLPLSVRCSPGEPNSARRWLERWSTSHFWTSYSKIGADVDSKALVNRDDLQSAEIQQGKSKRSVQKPSRTPKVPSYMAPTESARAKLRAQGLPGFSQDAVEKNAMIRRLSLPSPADGRSSLMSPQAQRPVHAAKAGIRIDKSRGGSVSDKLVKPQWRR